MTVTETCTLAVQHLRSGGGVLTRCPRCKRLLIAGQTCTCGETTNALLAAAWIRYVDRRAEEIRATPREQVRRPVVPEWTEEAVA